MLFPPQFSSAVRKPLESVEGLAFIVMSNLSPRLYIDSGFDIVRSAVENGINIKIRNKKMSPLLICSMLDKEGGDI